MRDNRYTYANYYEDGEELLYDRIADPTELVNLADNPDYNAVLLGLREKSVDYKAQYSRHQ